MKIGTCGWTRFPQKGDRLKNYASVFSVVEVNSTFYHLPREKTAERWLEKARAVNPKFEFTIKMPRDITHKFKFKEKSKEVFEKAKTIAHILEANILLFQTPASFVPNKANLTAVKKFFTSIDRENFILAWEVRWANTWTEEIVKPLFEQLDIVHVVDPLRQISFRPKFGYYRLHGFGRPMMYSYQFTDKELEKICKSIPKTAYVFFNNVYMYEDAKRFIEKCPKCKS